MSFSEGEPGDTTEPISGKETMATGSLKMGSLNQQLKTPQAMEGDRHSPDLDRPYMSGSSSTPKLNLVVCGSDGPAKASISALLLGHREGTPEPVCVRTPEPSPVCEKTPESVCVRSPEPSPVCVKREGTPEPSPVCVKREGTPEPSPVCVETPEPSPVCVKREGEVCGRRLTLVELPALSETQLSEQEVMREALRCVSLCDPGVHAFLLVLPYGHLTDADRAEMEQIQRVFSSRVNRHVIFLINQHPKHRTAELDEATMNAIESFKGRYHFYATTSMLLESVEKMVEENGGSFCTSTYLNEQVGKILKYETRLEKIMGIQFRETKIQQGLREHPDDLRTVLLGKTGVGKSATGNTILGGKVFKADSSAESVTSMCQREAAEVSGRQITVIDTPGLFDTELGNEEIQRELTNCISLVLPGPHVFLLLIQVGRFTTEERQAVDIIQSTFGENAIKHTIVLFTRGDDLEDKPIDQSLGKPGSFLMNLIEQCGKRYHVLNNKETRDHTQVSALLNKIDSMVAVNGGGYYTSRMFQQMEKALQEEREREMKEREEELNREKEDMSKTKKDLQAKYKAKMERMKQAMEEEKQNADEERRRREEEFSGREQRFRAEIKEKEEQKEQMQKEMTIEREEWERQKQERKKEKEEEEKREKEKKIWDENYERLKKEMDGIKQEKEEITIENKHLLGQIEIMKKAAEQEILNADKERRRREEEFSEREQRFRAEMKEKEEQKKKILIETTREQEEQKRERKKTDEEKEKRRKEEEHNWNECYKRLQRELEGVQLRKEEMEREKSALEVKHNIEMEKATQEIHNLERERKQQEDHVERVKREKNELERNKTEEMKREREEWKRQKQEENKNRDEEEERRRKTGEQFWNKHYERLEKDLEGIRQVNEKIERERKDLEVKYKAEMERIEQETQEQKMKEETEEKLRAEIKEKERELRMVEEMTKDILVRLDLGREITSTDSLSISPHPVHQQGVCTERKMGKDRKENRFLQMLLTGNYNVRYMTVGEESTVSADAKQIGVQGSSSRGELRTLVRIHPMDVQMAVFHRADHFLKQLIVTKLSQCQYALPLLVPNPFTKEIEFPLWTFQQIKKSWKTTNTKDEVISKSQSVCKVETPMVAFFRLGSVSSSKSLLMNSLINEKHNTFFHRNCPGSIRTRLLMDGVVEIAWYCPSGKPTDKFTDCIAFCNLHGDAGANHFQRGIVTDKATINVVLLPELDEDDCNMVILKELFQSPKPLIRIRTEDEESITEIGKGKYNLGLRNRNQADVQWVRVENAPSPAGLPKRSRSASSRFFSRLRQCTQTTTRWQKVSTAFNDEDRISVNSRLLNLIESLK